MGPGASTSPAPGSRSRHRVASAAIVGFLALQAVLAARGFAVDPYDDRGHFSWNMYAHRYACRGGYRLLRPDGVSTPLDPRSFLALPDRSPLVMRRAVLPDFHAYLCRAVAEGDGGPVRIEGEIVCTADHREPRTLVEPRVDLCASGARRRE